MKVGIVIPLKAKLVSKNWQEVCASVARTVHSVLNQSSNNFAVAVIGHDCPEQLSSLRDKGDDIFVKFDDTAPPKISDDEMANQVKYENDRCSKILKGLIHLKKQHSDITHWFALDADDLLHKDFVQTIESTPDFDAYLIENGYFYFERSSIFNKTDEFYIYCGSSSVIADKFFPLPDKVEGENYRCMPFGAISHVYMKDFFINEKMNFTIPEKPLMVYVRENGDNISDGYVDSLVKKLKLKAGMYLRRQSLSNQERANFSLN